MTIAAIFSNDLYASDLMLIQRLESLLPDC
jgi:hypothetical protein